jgi:hypothetical protein
MRTAMHATAAARPRQADSRHSLQTNWRQTEHVQRETSKPTHTCKLYSETNKRTDICAQNKNNFTPIVHTREKSARTKPDSEKHTGYTEMCTRERRTPWRNTGNCAKQNTRAMTTQTRNINSTFTTSVITHDCSTRLQQWRHNSCTPESTVSCTHTH